LDVKYSPKD